MPISTSTTFHDVKSVRATSTFTMGTPLTLTLVSHTGPDSMVSIFLNDEALVRRLIDAINGTAAASAPASPCPHEAAAYDALHRYGFPGLRR